jgi:hypothetical protein
MKAWLGALWFPAVSRLDAFRALEATPIDDGYRRGVVVRFAEPDKAEVQMRRAALPRKGALWFSRR